MDFQDLLAWFRGQNGGRGGAMLTPNELVLTFGGFLHQCKFWWKSIKKCNRESVQTDTCTLSHRCKPGARFSKNLRKNPKFSV